MNYELRITNYEVRSDNEKQFLLNFEILSSPFLRAVKLFFEGPEGAGDCKLY
jgi:hypothetical protein